MESGLQPLSYSFAVDGEESKGRAPGRGHEVKGGFLKIGDAKACLHADGWIW